MDSGEAMNVAARLASAVPGAIGPNPRVGCLILDRNGDLVGQGAHQGPGTPHAEVHALAEAGSAAAGATAVVTLEPCNHHGRTPPCTEALLAAGIGAVVYGVQDPTGAGGGAQFLRDRGVAVSHAPCAAATELSLPWATAVARGWPWVTYKVACSLDGYVAAPDGSSRWITSEQTRHQAHVVRAAVDAIVVGTGTWRADNPELTVRLPGVVVDRPPARVVMGLTPVGGRYRHLASRDPREGLSQLYADGVRHVLLEGGPTLGAAFLRADRVDEILWCQAPILLGGGTPAIGALGTTTLADAKRWSVVSVNRSGPDVVTVVRRP